MKTLILISLLFLTACEERRTHAPQPTSDMLVIVPMGDSTFIPIFIPGDSAADIERRDNNRRAKDAVRLAGELGAERAAAELKRIKERE